MIVTYTLFHDGLPIQSWSKSYEGAALAQLKRETMPGKWELMRVHLHPMTLQQAQFPVASREIEEERPVVLVEYVAIGDIGEMGRWTHALDAKKGWSCILARAEPGTYFLYRETNREQFTLARSATLVEFE